MADFSQFQRLEVSSTKQIDYIFPQLGGQVSVKVICATEENKPFFNAMLKRARKNNKMVQAGAINVNVVANNRNEDRELYAKYIVKGWSNVTDKSGKPVEFNETECLDFLKALPGHVFDGLREFCGNLMNFSEEESLDADTTGKN
jgi:hypothetical protein